MRTQSNNGSSPKKVSDELRRTNPGRRELKTWLDQHARSCLEKVESWLVGSLPVPSRLIHLVWPDPDWRRPLENAIIMPLETTPIANSGAGTGPHIAAHTAGIGSSTSPTAVLFADDTRAGLLRAVDPARGLGIVDVDGETLWLRSRAIVIPHPVLIPSQEAFRELATDLGYRQGIAQLYRKIFPLPEPPPSSAAQLDTFRGNSAARLDTFRGNSAARLDTFRGNSAARLETFQGGRFETLREARDLCAKLGYRVRGSYALKRVHERGLNLEARFRIGDDDPDMPTETGELIWVNEEERQQPLSSIGPVAYSEGLRMASAIYARRTLEEDDLHG